MLELSRRDAVFVLTMDGGENRFTLDFFRRFDALLDEVEQGAAEGGALVITGSGKFFSNGIDLDWLSAASDDDKRAFTPALDRFLGRLCVLPVPTVAALNGHAFAGGALFALAHDFRVMRQDRGWISLPEVDIGIPFDTGMQALLRAKLAPNVMRDAELLAPRYTGAEALAAGLVDAVAPEHEVLDHAITLAGPLAAKGRKIVGQLKRGMWGPVARDLGFEV